MFIVEGSGEKLTVKTEITKEDFTESEIKQEIKEEDAKEVKTEVRRLSLKVETCEMRNPVPIMHLPAA